MSVKHDKLKVAYIGGGSRGWAWGLMTDLAEEKDIGGTVYLYDIDFAAAKNNEIIGNNINNIKQQNWTYKATETIGEALEGADFVIISILPGTFDEMESDVHLPEEYGIYQAVGATVGPGGIIRTLRTAPMFEDIAHAVEKYCPDAWVINYTNPMSLSVATLYRAFPKIKAFGCCHEVFGTQILLTKMLSELAGIEDVKREDIKVNVVGVNHFTWLTTARYGNMDLYPMFREFVNKHYEEGYVFEQGKNHINNIYRQHQKIKFDLFLRYGVIAAAGDRHLVEFCPGDWYLRDLDQVWDWGYALTPVSWRKNTLRERLEKSAALVSGEKEFEFNPTGEEGVKQMRAILGLEDLVTNVNMPNIGQMPSLPRGAVVETNACFRAGTVTPVAAGELPKTIYPLISRVCGNQELLNEAIAERNLEKAFLVFVNDPLVRLPLDKARELFDRMIANTSKYLGMYNLEKWRRSGI